MASKHTKQFADAAAECIRTGETCLQHCLNLLAKGDTSLGECAQKVNQMLAVCRAVGTLADAGSSHLGSAASLCRDVCKDCEAACKPHVGHHPECAACAKACRNLIAAASRIIG